MYNSKDMYWIAQAIAIHKGPSVIRIDGKKIAAYTLIREEVEELFEDNHYNLDRITWRKAIKNWRRYGAIVPDMAIKPDYNGDWYILFDNIGKQDFLTLQLCAENAQCEHYPKCAEGALA